MFGVGGGTQRKIVQEILDEFFLFNYLVILFSVIMLALEFSYTTEQYGGAPIK